MAVKLTTIQKEMLQSAQYTRIMVGRYSRTINSLLEAGFMFRSWYEHDYSEYAITPAGVAYLYQDAPLVNQPQPAPEVEPLKVGDTVTFHDGFERLTGIIEFVRGEWIEILWNGGLKRRNVSDVRKVGK